MPSTAIRDWQQFTASLRDMADAAPMIERVAPYVERVALLAPWRRKTALVAGLIAPGALVSSVVLAMDRRSRRGAGVAAGLGLLAGTATLVALWPALGRHPDTPDAA